MNAAGFTFEVIPSRVDERRWEGERAEDCVLRVATEKAAAVACERDDLPIVAADTVVVLDSHVMGKPKDDAEAAAMLRMLSGRTHEVLTGVVVRLAGERRSHLERTRVRVASLTGAEIAWYVGTGEPRDKAGAYAVQGLASRFIEAVEGSYTNVVGLPVTAVCRLLGELAGAKGGSEDPPLPEKRPGRA